MDTLKKTALCIGTSTLLSAVAAAVVSSQALAEAPKESQVQWVKEHAIPFQTVEAGNGFADLQPLKELIGDARIVSLGECTHGSREVFQMKHRLVEFLATEMGFTIFSIEACMPESYRVNGYVLGEAGDPKQLIAGMYFWTWNTEEVLDMVEWMRHFNTQNTGRIEFTGFDMQTPDVAMDNVLAFLKRRDTDLHTQVKEAYGKVKRATIRPASKVGVASGSFPVMDARGKQVTFSGWVKTEDVEGWSGLWWYAHTQDSNRPTVGHMARKPARHTSDWTRCSISLDVPMETLSINFGVRLEGKGKAWFDGLEVRLDGEVYQNAELFDFDFEGDALKGLTLPPRLPGYRIRLDKEVAKVGKQSVLLKSFDSQPSDGLPVTVGLRLSREVLASLEEASDDLLKNADEKELEWMMQNARIVSQWMENRVTTRNIRDRCMAENVAWILKENPEEKVILWAHNLHVAKARSQMGKHLDEMFGDKYLAVAFSTASGEYQAYVRGKGLSVDDLQRPPEGSVEEVFRGTGIPRFVLDLREVSEDSDDSGWLAKPTQFRNIGAVVSNRQFALENLRQMYDAVVYIEETTAARPLKMTTASQ